MNQVGRIVCVGAGLMVALAGCAKPSSSTGSASSSQASPAASAMASVATNGAETSDGSKVFHINCSSCHQADGKGSLGVFPPLAGNPVVVGDPTKVIHIVRFGLNGVQHIEGTEYNGMMPAWKDQLSDADIASAITYIRSSWGNKASAVSEAAVKAVTQ